jgi:hypothetical protein
MRFGSQNLFVCRREKTVQSKAGGGGVSRNKKETKKDEQHGE